MGSVFEAVGAAVLAVDDYPPNLTALSVVLEPLGIDLFTAASGREALQRATERRYTVILLDVMMPEMDGFETLHRLRALPLCRDTPVVFLTAYEPDPVALEQLHGLGLIDYLLKPIAPVILRSKIVALASLDKRGVELATKDAALALKDQHIAMMAHDLQNPLAAAALAAELLSRTDLDKAQQRFVERITRVAARTREMVQNLTEVARVGQSAVLVRLKPMDLGFLAADVLRELSDPEAARVACSTVGDLTGHWDHNRLFQVLANLIRNALRYGEGPVALRVEAKGDEVELSVHNYGPPIPKDVLPVIFEPFERGRRDRPGLGLGLYIVQEITKAHGGSIAVSSSQTRGTNFTVRLPRRPSTVAFGASVPETPGAGAIAP